ncbi:acetyltransferase [Corynebacterium pelargi]|uniref:Putative N-acetyltransferase YjaB n=1 Tax=Corynebacterium pelargi TaxID=1471400 RepID=A0A410WA18_9CORY|nr:putative N-acetyltransferase YjaB [Corynebacterium pelargi]GGG78863.1 acetyltransferase [Corynebacterium pelargi]
MPEANHHHVVQIRPSEGPHEYQQLVHIWEASVRATHTFLSEQHFEEIRGNLAEGYFPQVELHVATIAGKPVGFSGTHGDSLEMLFIHPDWMRHGIGTRLLHHALERGITRLDVNEENPQAIAFYQHHGFTTTSRSETDEAGLPYPILHMVRS